MRVGSLSRHSASPGQAEYLWHSELPATRLATPSRAINSVKPMEAAEPVRALFGVEECQALEVSQGSRTGAPGPALDARPRDFQAFFAQLGHDAEELRSPPRRPSCPARPPDHRAVQRRLFPEAEPTHPRMHQLHAQTQEEVGSAPQKIIKGQSRARLEE